MGKDEFKSAQKLIRRYRVSDGKKFKLRDYDPGDTGDFKSEDKSVAQEALADGIQTLIKLQGMLYAQDCSSVLAIFQALDAAGKDSAIKHVMSGLNPAGTQVAAFKAPSPEELDHDFLWRCERKLPERGCVGIFNRSYYEEVLVVRVHPELLEKQKLSPELQKDDEIWEARFQDIRNFERYLTRNGTRLVKFFLNVSKGEQRRRFLERLDDPAKQWKVSSTDLTERACWKKYQRAYEDMICATATEEAPWYVVPADHKWFTRIVVAYAMVDALESLELRYPEITKEQKAELAKMKRELSR